MGPPIPDRTPSTYCLPTNVTGDPSATVLDLYDWNAAHNSEYPLFRYVEHDSVHDLSWQEVNDAARRAASFFAKCLPHGAHIGVARPVVAILANCGRFRATSVVDCYLMIDFIADSGTYFCSMVGALRAGFTVFPISPRNSPEAVAHLFEQVKPCLLFTNADMGQSLQNILSRAMQLMRESKTGSPPFAQHTLPTFEDMFCVHPTNEASYLPEVPSKPWRMGDPMCVMHSSG